MWVVWFSWDDYTPKDKSPHPLPTSVMSREVNKHEQLTFQGNFVAGVEEIN